MLILACFNEHKREYLNAALHAALFYSMTVTAVYGCPSQLNLQNSSLQTKNYLVTNAYSYQTSAYNSS